MKKKVLKFGAIITLEVEEAYTRDIGRGVVRIDWDAMDTLSIHQGDSLIIKGKRATVATCQALYPSDEGKGIIRMDANVRNNSITEIGGSVEITKIPFPSQAEEIVLAPLFTAGRNWETFFDQSELFRSDFVTKMKNSLGLALENRVFVCGDNLMLELPLSSGFRYMSGEEDFAPNSGTLLGFQVIAVTPETDIFSVGKTVFKIAIMDIKDPDEPKCFKCKTELFSTQVEMEKISDFVCPTCGSRVVM